MTAFRFSGNGTTKAFLKDVMGLIVVAKNTTQTVVAAKTLAGWQTLIDPATTGAIKATYIDLARGFDLKTKAAEMVTANTGFDEKTMDYPPQFEAYGYISYDDYKAWFAGDANEFDFVPVLADGKLLTPLTSAGLQIGFCGRLFVKYDLPKATGAEKTKAHAFTIMFDDVEQMKNYQVLTPTNFTRKELAALSPIGIKLEVQTAYESSGGTVVLKATKRATGDPYNGFTAYTQFEVVGLTTDSGGAATAIDATMAAVGVYTVTFLNSAAKLTGPFQIQANTVSGSNITYLSNVLNVPV